MPLGLHQVRTSTAGKPARLPRYDYVEDAGERAYRGKTYLNKQEAILREVALLGV